MTETIIASRGRAGLDGVSLNFLQFGIGLGERDQAEEVLPGVVSASFRSAPGIPCGGAVPA